MKSHETDMSGFSILELIVVVAIIGILSGLSIVTFGQRLQKENLKLSTREATAWLQALQNKAIQQNKICEIVIDKSLNKASQITSTDSAINEDERCTNIGSYNFEATIQSLNTDGQNNNICPLGQEAGKLVITYTARGTLPCGGEILLTRDDTNTTRCIALSAPLGVIREGIQHQGTCDYTSAH